MSSSGGGSLLVVAAASGAGKTSLVSALVAGDAEVAVSVSHTTRPPRPAELDGREYHFVDEQRFEELVRDGAFLEHARVFQNRYGTTRAAVDEQLRAGLDVVLEIDWQGARQVRELFPDAVSVFILPPSRDELRARLTGRGQDSAEVIDRRMAQARSESSHWDEFDFIVVNGRFDQALADLRAIVMALRLRRGRQRYRLAGLLADLLVQP